mmetsp:Transcript_38328/g.49557  ORF Transcript_38328/g.49557 Transcript_38328/m.49557 type:complete len:598 (+) Transcript_38328:715-2508(+)
MGEKRENFAKLQTSASNTIESNLYLFGNTNQNQKNQSDNKEGLKKKRQSIIKSIAKVMKTESINDMKAPIEEEGTPSFINRFEESNSSSSNGNGNAINNIKTPVGEDEITPSFINRFESTAQLSEIKLFTYERSLSASFDQESKEAEINENKIKQDALEDKDDIVDIGKIVWSISDALRYTVLLDVNTYTEGVKKIMERLNEEGMFIVSKKNFWPRGDGYQGINNVFGLKCEDSINGVFKFEVQFHTQDSFDFKMSSHGLYEDFRQTLDPDAKLAIFKECCRQADEIPVPPDVLSIPTHKIRAQPYLEGLYVDLLIARALRMKDAALLRVSEDCKDLTDKYRPTIKPDLMTRSGAERRLSHEIQLQKRKRKKINSKRALENNEDGDSGGEKHHECQLSQDYESELLKAAVMSISDSLVINIILPEEHYAIASAIIMTRLFASQVLDSSSTNEQTFTEVKSVNGWRVPASFNASGVSGGVGVLCYVTMQGTHDGVAFTCDDAYPLVIAFHTVKSHQSMLSMKAARSEFRSSNTPFQREKALARAREAVSSVPVPRGALILLSNQPKYLIENQTSNSNFTSGNENSHEETSTSVDFTKQ